MSAPIIANGHRFLGELTRSAPEYLGEGLLDLPGVWVLAPECGARWERRNLGVHLIHRYDWYGATTPPSSRERVLNEVRE